MIASVSIPAQPGARVDELPAVTQSGRHVPALDGIRGMAILLVLLHHATVMRGATTFDQAYLMLAHLGWFGVDLFFVLSGFLITGILLDAKGSPHYFRNFYARRFLRIFPLYYALLVVATILLPLVAADSLRAHEIPVHSSDEIWYWLYLSNFSVAAAHQFGNRNLDVSWSLAIEEQFYLIWPLMVMLLRRESLLRLSGALVVGALALRVTLAYGLEVDRMIPYVITPCRMDGLALGAMLAIAARTDGGLKRLVPIAKVVACVGAAAVAALVIQVTDFHEMPHHQAATAFTTRFIVFGPTLVCLSFGAMLVLSVAGGPGALRGLMTSGPMRSLGKYSYCIYLIHVPIILAVQDVVFGPPEAHTPRIRFPIVLHSQFVGQWLFYALCLPIIMGIAWLSWRLYENPILSLKRYFPSGGESARPGPQSR